MEVDMAVEKISAHSISFQTDLSTKPVPAKRSSEWPVLESETGRLYKTSDTASLISIRTGEESESEDDSELYVGMPLPSANFSLEELQTHLSTHNWTEAGQKLLSEIGENGESVITPGIFDKYSRVEEEQHHQHHTVFDVRTDGTPISRSKIEHSEDRVDGDGELWSVIQVHNLLQNEVFTSLTLPSELELGQFITASCGKDKFSSRADASCPRCSTFDSERGLRYGRTFRLSRGRGQFNSKRSSDPRLAILSNLI
jgi:hypothetical protein